MHTTEQDIEARIPRPIGRHGGEAEIVSSSTVTTWVSRSTGIAKELDAKDGIGC